MKWTFGVVFSQIPYLPAMIRSISNQEGLKSTDYEILLVGHATNALAILLKEFEDKPLSVIDFDESLRPAWITRKKNIITQKAKFENICYMHDHVALCKGWYLGYDKFGYDWDVCMNSIRNLDGSRFRDWVQAMQWWGAPKFLPYEDSSKTDQMYVSGTYWCAKRDYMMQNPLDEQRVWGQGEDVEWSTRCRNTWRYRMNSFSAVRLLREKVYMGEIVRNSADGEDTNKDMPLHLFDIQE